MQSDWEIFLPSIGIYTECFSTWERAHTCTSTGTSANTRGEPWGPAAHTEYLAQLAGDGNVGCCPTLLTPSSPKANTLDLSPWWRGQLHEPLRPWPRSIFGYSPPASPHHGHVGCPGAKPRARDSLSPTPLFSARTCKACRLSGTGSCREVWAAPRMFDAKKPAGTRAKRTKALVIGVHVGRWH